MPFTLPFLGQLARYGQKYPEERPVAEKFSDFIKAHPKAFENDCAPGHVTGSAWILSPSGDKTLLTHHKKLGKWLQLGGHSDGEIDPLKTALREAREESGLQDFEIVSPEIFDLDVHLIPARKGDPEHCHFDVRFLLRARDEKITLSDESHALSWVERDQVASLTDEESVLRMVRKWRARGAPGTIGSDVR